MQALYVTPGDDDTTQPGGGPDSPGGGRSALRSQGLLSFAFGIALGIALVVFSLVAHKFKILTGVLLNLSLGYYFLVGLIMGTLIAGIYNFLVVRRLNLFGLESRVD